MGSRKNLGKTIIDGLKIAYTINSNVRKNWASEKHVLYFGDVVLTRIGARVNFPHYFSVNYLRRKVACLYFHDDETDIFRKYVHVRIENYVLYDCELLKVVLTQIERIGLTFDHFTSIDLARDYGINVVYQLNRLMRSERIATIINGKWINDRKEILSNIKEERSRSLIRSHYPELVIKQQGGNQLKAYNKVSEIVSRRKSSNDDSYKNYIVDYYGNAPSIHRLEVSIDSCKLRKLLVSQERDMLFCPDFLDELYVRCVSAILSFSLLPKKQTSQMRPRQQVPLDIIFGTGTDITKLCQRAKKYQPKELKYTRLKPVDLIGMEQDEVLPSVDEYDSTLDDLTINGEWLITEFDM